MASRRIRSKKYTRERQQTRRRRFLIYAGIILLVLGGLIWGSHQQAVQLEEITIENETTVSDEAIRDLTNSILKEPLLGIISRENIVLLPRNKISARLKSVSTSIKSVNVDLTGLRSISIQLDRRQPVARICVAGTPGGSNCRLVDEDGYVFTSKEAGATSTVGLTYLDNEPAELNSQFLPPATFSTLTTFINTLTQLDMHAQEVRLLDHADADIVVYDNDNPQPGARSVTLKINVYSNLPQVFSNLQTVIEKDSLTTSTPEMLEGSQQTQRGVSPYVLEYIDLRFENKVFYR